MHTSVMWLAVVCGEPSCYSIESYGKQWSKLECIRQSYGWHMCGEPSCCSMDWSGL